MPAPDAAFYFDLASPLAYLAAERILHTLACAAEWQPVLARELQQPQILDPAVDRPLQATRERRRIEAVRAEVEHRAHELGLQPLAWPEDYPFDSALAMRAATYAKSIGRTVPFAQAAFRQAFAGGRTLADTDNVLIAAAACEMHPSAVLAGTELASVSAQLSAATAAAAQAGVSDVPAVRIDEMVFVGQDAIDQAAAHLAAVSSPHPAAISPRVDLGVVGPAEVPDRGSDPGLDPDPGPR